MNPNVVIIHPEDNVAIALEDIAEGSAIQLPADGKIIAQSDIPYSHKVALLDIASDANIIKYGEIIGQAKDPIKKGEWIHTHNLLIHE